MSIYKIDINSTIEEIEDFYSLYVESFKDLCIWKGVEIINLADYLKPTNNKKEFFDDLHFTIKGMGIIIYYTHNDDVITSISFVEMDEHTNCFVKIKFLCGNQTTKDVKINGKSQGIYLLDGLFNIYKKFIILIEPATPDLIPYYTNYKKPCFPYDEAGLRETSNYLIFGNLSILPEYCFANLFVSIGIINKLVKVLLFETINNLYSRTNNITDLKEKLITKLDFLVKTKQLKPQYYENILENIMDIKYYDIHDIMIKSYEFTGKLNSNSKNYLKSGGKKYSKSKKKRIFKKRKYTRSRK